VNTYVVTVTAKVSPEQRMALAAVEKAQGKGVSELIRRALVEQYDLDRVVAEMLNAGTSWFAQPCETETSG
jgi:DNA-binding MarR family transcriptional regulator